MKDLIKRNYASIEKRGLINEETSELDFLVKIEEELEELNEAYDSGLPNRNEELADIILVCLNYAEHFGIDIEKELNKKIDINEKRKD
jgi:NTP pyrophosphatase (non-canonical NTP hydrolase)